MIIKRKRLDQVSCDNAISVIKKLFTGSFVIMFVGICAFVSLLLLMRLI